MKPIPSPHSIIFESFALQSSSVITITWFLALSPLSIVILSDSPSMIFVVLEKPFVIYFIFIVLYSEVGPFSIYQASLENQKLLFIITFFIKDFYCIANFFRFIFTLSVALIITNFDAEKIRLGLFRFEDKLVRFLLLWRWTFCDWVSFKKYLELTNFKWGIVFELLTTDWSCLKLLVTHQ